MKILGISAYYHDSAAALVVDGKIVAAAQEERFTRKKHDSSFPEKAIEYCLKEGNIQATDLDYVAFYEKTFLKFERLLESYLAFAPRGIQSFIKAMPIWIKQKLWIKELVRDELKFQGPIIFPDHHESHAASAFYASPFKDAAIITADGVGEWATASYGIGQGNQMKILSEIHFPHSLGLLYSAFTYYCGFRVNSGEYKLMGLAPYGEPKYKDLIFKHLIDLKEDGSFKLNLEYFNYPVGLTMTSSKFHDLFGGPPRRSETKISQRDMDLARSIQEVTEEVMIRMAKHVHKETGMENLCLAGGVALNCVANGKLLNATPFKNIWIQPAAGDAGGSLGAALYVWYQYLGNKREVNGRDFMRGSYLGPSFSRDEIRDYLKKENIPYTELSDDQIPEIVSDLIAQEKVIGWFQGRLEFGPRALGNRSIIGDARSPKMQETMNLKIKFRESFRPFAPAVLKEKVSDYFELDSESPYMLIVAPVRKELRKEMTDEQKQLFGLAKLNVSRSTIPAVTHVDYSARIQTIDKETNPLFHRLLERFNEKHKCPVLINTSFNVRGEPVVLNPEHAFKCFMRTHMDYLVLGNFLLDKAVQKPLEKDENWKKQYELD
jgi:carbamoyltransferase